MWSREQHFSFLSKKITINEFKAAFSKQNKQMEEFRT